MATTSPRVHPRTTSAPSAGWSAVLLVGALWLALAGTAHAGPILTEPAEWTRVSDYSGTTTMSADLSSNTVVSIAPLSNTDFLGFTYCSPHVNSHVREIKVRAARHQATSFIGRIRSEAANGQIYSRFVNDLPAPTDTPNVEVAWHGAGTAGFGAACAHTHVYSSGANAHPPEWRFSLDIQEARIEDLQAPEVGPPQVPSGWISDPSVAVSFTSTDNDLFVGATGLRIAGTQIGLGAATGTINHNLDVSGLDEGIYPLVAYRGASSGWTEATASTPLRIDHTPPPEPTLTLTQAWTNGPVAITTTEAPDAGSGFSHNEFSLNGGPWAQMPSDFEITDEGETTIQARSVDVAGNASSPTPLRTARVDLSAPTVSISARVTAPGVVSVIASATDGPSTLESWMLRLDRPDGPAIADGTTGSITRSFSDLPEGHRRIHLVAHDHAGNVAVAATEVVRVDRTAPIVDWRISEFVKRDTYSEAPLFVPERIPLAIYVRDNLDAAANLRVYVRSGHQVLVKGPDSPWHLIHHEPAPTIGRRALVFRVDRLFGFCSHFDNAIQIRAEIEDPDFPDRLRSYDYSVHFDSTVPRREADELRSEWYSIDSAIHGCRRDGLAATQPGSWRNRGAEIARTLFGRGTHYWAKRYPNPTSLGVPATGTSGSAVDPVSGLNYWSVQTPAGSSARIYDFPDAPKLEGPKLSPSAGPRKPDAYHSHLDLFAGVETSFVNLNRPVTVRGQWLTRDDRPIPRMVVAVIDADGRIRARGITDESGNFRMRLTARFSGYFRVVAWARVSPARIFQIKVNPRVRVRTSHRRIRTCRNLVISGTVGPNRVARALRPPVVLRRSPAGRNRWRRQAITRVDPQGRFRFVIRTNRSARMRYRVSVTTHSLFWPYRRWIRTFDPPVVVGARDCTSSIRSVSLLKRRGNIPVTG